MACILFFQLVMTMLCEVPQEQVFQDGVLTPGQKKMLAGHYQHAKLCVTCGPEIIINK